MTQPIKALILDMDGVLWRDDDWLIEPGRTFGRIRSVGLQVALATNNATRTPAHYLAKFAAKGVELETWQVVTSAVAAADFLRAQYPAGGAVFVVGETGLEEALVSRGFQIGGPDPLAVVSGLDRQVTYDKLKLASFLVRRGVPFIGTNPDLSFPTPEGLTPGAGAIQAAITAATGIAPLIIGKPQSTMYQQVLARMGAAPGETLVIGDRLDTDILGAQRLGCRTGLVLSGVTTAEQAAAWTPQPNFIAPNLEQLLDQVIP